MSHKRRPTLMGGLLWTGLGVVFLLNSFRIGPGVRTMVGRYWPILLILLGLGKVIDYLRQKEGVSLRVGEVFGIFFLLLIGSVLTLISRSHFPIWLRNFPIDIGERQVPIGDFLGNSYTFSQEAAYHLTSPVPLRIDNAYGNVAVTQGGDREIKVRLAKKVYQNEESQARKIADEIRLEGGTDAGIFVVKTNREVLASKDYRFRTDMEVSIPRKSLIQVRTSYGDIRITNVTGKFDLSTIHRQLDIRDCNGDVEASNRYGDSRIINLTGNLNIEARGPVYLETIKGDVAVRNEYSPVEIKSVEGKVSVSNTENKIDLEEISKPVVIDARGGQIVVRNLKESLKITARHSRRLQVSDVASSVVLNSSYSSPSLKNIKGNVEIDSKSDELALEGLQGFLKIRGEGSSVRVNTVAGPIDIVTTGKDVVVNDFGGSCKVTNEDGDVKLSTRNRLKGDVSIKNRRGAIDLFLPDDASFLVDAAARNGGGAESDFEGIVPVEAAGNIGMLKGKVNAGGPRIVLETEYNKIRLRKQGSEASKNSGN